MLYIYAQRGRTRVIGDKSHGHIVRARIPDAHSVTVDGVVKVVGRVTGAANHPEVVTMEMHRVLKVGS